MIKCDGRWDRDSNQSDLIYGTHDMLHVINLCYIIVVVAQMRLVIALALQLHLTQFRHCIMYMSTVYVIDSIFNN